MEDDPPVPRRCGDLPEAAADLVDVHDPEGPARGDARERPVAGGKRRGLAVRDHLRDLGVPVDALDDGELAHQYALLIVWVMRPLQRSPFHAVSSPTTPGGENSESFGTITPTSS